MTSPERTTARTTSTGRTLTLLEPVNARSNEQLSRGLVQETLHQVHLEAAPTATVPASTLSRTARYRRGPCRVFRGCLMEKGKVVRSLRDQLQPIYLYKERLVP